MRGGGIGAVRDGKEERGREGGLRWLEMEERWEIRRWSDKIVYAYLGIG